jgi:hypothetical protein
MSIRRKITPAQARELLKKLPRKETLRIEEFARFTGINEGDVYELISDGQVAACNIAIAPGSRPLYRIYQVALQVYLERVVKEGSETTRTKEK